MFTVIVRLPENGTYRYLLVELFRNKKHENPFVRVTVLIADRQKDMTNPNGALLQRFVMRETETTTELLS